MGRDARFEAVIGLEVHAQLQTRTKAFCGCSTEFGGRPNGSVCPVCLGMPGALPVLNLRVVEFILRMGIALGCTIARRSILARKNYFYPDLPKGYQISQYEEPICADGSVEIDLDEGGRKRIGVARIHMEEDAGKLLHDLDTDTLVDANRCGVPLIEIVSAPDLRSPREAHHFLARIRQIVMYLGICDGNMEEGSLRCDANVSVRPAGTDRFGTKTEIKNLNSLRHVERALEFEIGRQVRLLEDGGTVVQETLLWDAGRNVAIPMRSKEEAHDYRYFPDPDLVPVIVEPDWIDRIRQALPELPAARRDRLMASWGLPRYDAEILTAEKDTADYFEGALASLGGEGDRGKENAKAASNWVMTDVLRVIAERRVSAGSFPVTPENLAAMIGLIQDGTISGKIAKDLFDVMVASGEAPRAIIDRKGWVQLSDPAAIGDVVDAVLAAHGPQVGRYIGGNEKLFGFFVGETIKRTGGKANPAVVNEILRRRLNALRHS